MALAFTVMRWSAKACQNASGTTLSTALTPKGDPSLRSPIAETVPGASSSSFFVSSLNPRRGDPSFFHFTKHHAS